MTQYIKMLTVAALVLATSTQVTADDWGGFRGPQGNPVTSSQLPLEWDVEKGTNIGWKSKLPGRGVSGPIVVGKRVFVTASGGVNQQRLYVLCFDVTSGKQLWRRDFWATGRTYSHPTSANAAPTPVSDGKLLFAFYSSNDLICLDLDGNLKWYRGLAHDYPKAGNDVGMAASPVVAGNVVIVQIENQGDSFACAIDKNSGLEVWRKPRDPRANWSSPTTYIHHTGAPTVILQSGSGLNAFDADTGQKVWDIGLSCGTVSSPLVVDNTLYVTSGGITKLDLNSSAEKPKVIWAVNKLNANGASPVVLGDNFYALAGAIAKGANSNTGEILWQLRLKGRFWATPILANNHLYFINQDGLVQIVELAGDGKTQTASIVTVIDMGESVLGTPAAADNALFIRGDKHLWKVTDTTKVK
ncbi:MAG: PQQ-binding-like beta-propeller repeat protein [Pirellulaceae bacterium]|nr:PQQ-binding-like beta-propeller repeat protein [Pirellulaceae bacterium]